MSNQLWVNSRMWKWKNTSLWNNSMCAGVGVYVCHEHNPLNRKLVTGSRCALWRRLCGLMPQFPIKSHEWSIFNKSVKLIKKHRMCVCLCVCEREIHTYVLILFCLIRTHTITLYAPSSCTTSSSLARLDFFRLDSKNEFTVTEEVCVCIPYVQHFLCERWCSALASI